MKSGWQTKSLREVCEIKPQKSEARARLGPDALVSFVPMEDLGIDQKHVIASQEKPLGSVVGSYTYFGDGDVLLAKITPCFENGKLGIAEKLQNGTGFGSSEFIVFRPSAGLDKEFLYYFLSRPEFRDEGAVRMGGAVGHQRVPKEFIENYRIPIPRLCEQRRIVGILDEAFGDIAIAKANAEKNLQNAHALFESELRLVFDEELKSSMVRPLGAVCDLLGGFAFKSGDAVDSSQTQLVRMGNLYGNTLNLDRAPVFYPDSFAREYRRYLLHEGDLIMSLTGTTGKEDYGYTVRVPHCNHSLLMNQRIAKFDSLNEQLVDGTFLYFYLRSRPFLDILYSTANGTRQANLSSVTIKALSIPLCPLQRQRNLAKSLEEVILEAKRLEVSYQQKLILMDSLRRSLLHQAFTGQL